MSDALALIGDVHGCLSQLEQVVSLALEDVDELVFLGDYVNRGPNSAGVLDFLIDLSMSLGPRIHLLGGNHDLAMLEVLDGGDLDALLLMGGAQTIRSYIKPPYEDVERQFQEAVPEAHIDFLRGLKETFEVDGLVAIHDASKTESTSYVVAGHKVKAILSPDIGRGGAFIDTGCGTVLGGRLSCLFWPSLRWVQSTSWT